MRVTDFLSWPTSPDLTALAGVCAMIVGGVSLIASGMTTRREALAARVRLVSPRNAAEAPARTSQSPHAWVRLERLRSLASGLSHAERRQIARMFARVGVAADLAAPYFILARLAAAAALGALGFLLVSPGSPRWLSLAAVAGAAFAGWIAPILLVSLLVKQRVKSVATGLPNALELLVVCVEAGLSLEDGLQRVARELEESHPALSGELAQTWAEINILPDRTQALANFAERIDNRSVRSVVGVLSQGLRYGTPLAQALRSGVIEMRNDQMMAMDERTSRLPALMTIPVMIFLMPALLLIILGPVLLSLTDLFHSMMH